MSQCTNGEDECETTVLKLVNTNRYEGPTIPHAISESNNKIEKSVATFVEPVIAFTLYALQSASVERVKLAVVGNFSSEDIAIAKKCLWDKCRSHVIGSEMPKRRDSTARSLAEANITDIITALSKLDKAECLPNVLVDAYSLGKLPRWHPEEANEVSLADRMMRMESRMNSVFDSLDRTIAENLILKERVERMEKNNSYADAVRCDLRDDTVGERGVNQRSTGERRRDSSAGEQPLPGVPGADRKPQLSAADQRRHVDDTEEE